MVDNFDNPTSRGTKRDFTFDCIDSRDTLRLPNRFLATEPVRPKGSLLANVSDCEPYYSDGLAWLKLLTTPAGGAVCLIDADGDTSVCVDDGADNDTITMTTAGVLRGSLLPNGGFFTGDARTAAANAHAEGGAGTTAIGTNSHSEGLACTVVGTNSHGEGLACTTIGSNSHGEGLACTAVGAQCHAEGLATLAVGDESHAEGLSSSSIGTASHSEGTATTAVGVNAHAEGTSSLAVGAQSHAEGNATTASGDNSHAEGLSCRAVGLQSHSGGTSCLASGIDAHAMGTLCTASALSSFGLGQASNASSAGCFVWNDSSSGLLSSPGLDTFLVQSTGLAGTGVRFFTGPATNMSSVSSVVAPTQTSWSYTTGAGLVATPAPVAAPGIGAAIAGAAWDTSAPVNMADAIERLAVALARVIGGGIP